MLARPGAVAEPEVTIDMRSKRYDLAGEVRDLGSFVTGLKLPFFSKRFIILAQLVMVEAEVSRSGAAPRYAPRSRSQ